MTERFDTLRKKFGMGNTQKNIVDNLIKIPVRDTGLNVPVTDVFQRNYSHQVDLLYLPDDNGFKFALVCVDLESSYIGAEPLKDNKSSSEALKALLKIYKTVALRAPVEPLASLLKPLAFEVPPSLATCLLSSRHLLFFQEPLALLGEPLAVLLENESTFKLKMLKCIVLLCI